MDNPSEVRERVREEPGLAGLALVGAEAEGVEWGALVAWAAWAWVWVALAICLNHDIWVS